MDQFIVYGLLDTRPDRINELRYIGKSSSGMKRPRRHLGVDASNKRTKLGNWLRALRGINLLPEIVVLRTCEDASSVIAAEIEEIRLARSAGADLVNVTDGGEGAPGRRHTDEAKEKMAVRRRGKTASAATRARLAAKVFTAETRERMAAAKRGTHLSSATKEKISKAGKGRKLAFVPKPNSRGKPKSDAAREKMSIAKRGIKKSPETRRRMSAAQKRRARERADPLGKQLCFSVLDGLQQEGATGIDQEGR